MSHPPKLPSNASFAEVIDGVRMHAPSAERNAAAITQAVTTHAAPTGVALEIASGTGQHVAQLAHALPGLTWQPTDVDPDRCASIDAWADGIDNVLPARQLNATLPGWGAQHEGQDVILLVNLLHLIRDDEVQILIDEAAQALGPGGRLFFYGPFLRDGQAISDGDARFDASLRSANPAIGYKDVADVQNWLAETGLEPIATLSMPANNLTLIYERPSEARL